MKTTFLRIIGVVVTLMLALGLVPREQGIRLLQAAAPAGVRIQVTNGEVPLRDWPVEFTTNLADLGVTSGRVDPAAVEVWELDAAGHAVALKTTQFDPDSGSTSAGTVAWLLDGVTLPGATRRFEIRVGARRTHTARSAVQVETGAADVIVTTPLYELVFQRRAGGTLRAVTVKPSGRTVLVRQDDALFAEKQGERGAWRLASEATPEFSVVTSGPVRTVLDVRTRFRQAGRGRSEGILGTYRYTFWATVPVIGISAILPAQPVPEPISILTLFHYFIDVTGSFTSWVTGGPQATGTLSGSGKWIAPNAGAAAQPWIALMGPDIAFGLVGPSLGPLYDGKTSIQLMGYAVRPWQGRAWAGEPFEWTGYLYVGASNAVEQTMQGVGQLALSLHGQAVGSADRVQQTIKVLTAQAAKGTGPSAAAAKSLALAAAMINRAAQERSASGRDLVTARSLAAWAGEVASQAARVLSRGTAPPPVPVLLQYEKFAAVANEHLGLLFETSDSATELLSIFHKGGRGFVRAGSTPRSLWEVRMQDSAGRTVVGISSLTGPARLTTERNGGILRLTWQWRTGATTVGLARPSVRATISMAAGDPMTRWRVAVDSSDSQLTLSEIAFPIIAGLGRDRLGSAPDFAAIPRKSGILLPDPATSGTFDLAYPGDARMQLMAYWFGATGLYLATHDGQGFLKRYDLIPGSGRTFDYRVITVIPGSGRSFSLPYDAVVGVFDGDWYDAAKLYRKWALKQHWVPKRPLVSNTDIPLWWRATHLVFRPDGDPQEVVPAMKALHEYFSMPAIVNWYFWNEAKDLYDGSPHVIPRLGFREAASALRQQQMPVVPYMPFLIWDTRSQSWKVEQGQQAAVLDKRGHTVLMRFDAPGLVLAAMCPVTSVWQKKVAETVSRVLEAGDVGGVYLDLAGTNVSAPCYASDHGHAPGGGTYYVDGLRTLLKIVRETARRRNPNFIILSEDESEPFLDLIDAYLMYHTTLADLTPLNVPMFQAVYGDYMRPYGVKHIGVRQHPVDALQGAQAFIFGARIGRIFNDSLLKEQPEYAEYLRELAQYRQAGFAYLAYGEMLRPLRIEYVSAPSAGLVEKREAIQTSSWRAPDRSVGFFFTNATVALSPLRFTFRMVPADYGIPVNGSYVLYRLTPEGLNRVVAITGPIERTEVLPSLGILAFVARPGH